VQSVNLTIQDSIIHPKQQWCPYYLTLLYVVFLFSLKELLFAVVEGCAKCSGIRSDNNFPLSLCFFGVFFFDKKLAFFVMKIG
jgi:hypothetical protein